MTDFIYLGKINVRPLEAEFGKLKTDDIIITNERIEHIMLRHSADYELFEKYGVSAVTDPDIVIKDCKNKATVFMIKRLSDTNINVVARLVISDDSNNLKNSVMTFYRIRNKNLLKLIKSNKVLDKNE